MRYLKTFENYKINEMVPGSMGAIAGGQYKSQKPTEEKASDKPDEFLCDIFVYKNNVEENKYKVENVKIKFINSDGYTSYDSLKKNK
jgi:hypothetical protein